LSKFAVLFLLMYSSLLAKGVFKGPHWIFYLYQMVYFFNPNIRWWFREVPNLPYSFIVSVSMLLLFVAKYSSFQKNQITKIPYFKWLVLFLISYGLVTFYAISRPLHLQATIEFYKLFIVMGIAYKLLDDLSKFEGALFAYLTANAYLAFEVFSVGRNSGDRVEGIGLIDAPDANTMAATFVPAIPLLIFYFWYGSKKVKIYCVLIGVFILDALVLINSRGAFLGVILGVMLFFYAMLAAKTKTKNQKKLVLLFVFMGLLGASVFIDESFINRMETITEDSDNYDTSGVRRTQFWLASIEMSKDHPFGTGAYGFDYLSVVYLTEELLDKGNHFANRAVHSIWFQAFSEMGYHGFLFFFMIIIITLRMIRKIKIYCKERDDTRTYFLAHAVYCGFIGLLFSSSFINQFRVNLIYWFIMFIAALYSIIFLQNKDESNHDIEDKKKLEPT